MIYKVSVSQGRGDMRHNNREFLAKNVDPERVKNNIAFHRDSLLAAYEKCFEQSCLVNNGRQTRKDRMLTPAAYLQKVERGQGKKNNPKPFYESVIQIGNQDNAGFKSNPHVAEKMIRVLSQYADDFQKRNPNLYVFNAVLHADEATPHLHIDWIPIARGYKTGMPIRNSLERAINQQGTHAHGPTDKHNNARAEWQKQEMNHLVHLCREHGISASWEQHDIAEQKLSVADFKKLARINERMATDKIKEFDDLNAFNKIRRGIDVLNKASEAAERRLTASNEAVKRQDQLIADRGRELERRTADVEEKEKESEEDRQARDAALKEREMKMERQEQELQTRLQDAQRALDNLQEKKKFQDAEQAVIKKKFEAAQALEETNRKNQEKFKEEKAAFDKFRQENPDIFTAQQKIDKLNKKIADKEKELSAMQEKNQDLRNQLSDSESMRESYRKMGAKEATEKMTRKLDNLREYHKKIFDALKQAGLFDYESFDKALHADEYYVKGWNTERPFYAHMNDAIKSAKSSLVKDTAEDLAAAQEQLRNVKQEKVKLENKIKSYDKVLSVYGVQMVKNGNEYSLQKQQKRISHQQSHDRGRGGGMEM